MDDWDNDSCFLPAQEVQLDIDVFRQDMISTHNHYRKMHDSRPLICLPELEETAQEWAEQIASKGYLQYCDLTNIGENICVIDSSKTIPCGKDVVRTWYREIKHYSFSEPGWKKGAFHFTQMVWKNTSHIGIGAANAPGQYKLFVVARYFSAGNSNMPGEFHRNVMPRISLPSESTPGLEECLSRTFSGRLRSFVLEDVFV